jgi:hypothetical protein
MSIGWDQQVGDMGRQGWRFMYCVLVWLDIPGYAHIAFPTYEDTVGYVYSSIYWAIMEVDRYELS